MRLVEMTVRANIVRNGEQRRRGRGPAHVGIRGRLVKSITLKTLMPNSTAPKSRALKARALGLVAVLGGALFLSGCEAEREYRAGGPKHLRPISSETYKLMAAKGMRASDPILIRVFKKEKELEMWKRDKTGKFALLRTYPICAVGGTIGPKIKEGDKQSPEGFYTVTPAHMNPNSAYHLSFNLGFPNRFDAAHGRNGSHLMVHGACSSAGCFAMTDPQMEDIYALAREAFRGGQPAFQVQAYPFRMTAQNLARYRTSPHMAFWKNLKDGHDHFEVTRVEPKVEVCNRRYVFNPMTTDPSSTAFNASGACPSYDIPQHIKVAVASKQQKDEAEKKIVIAQLEKEAEEALQRELATKIAKARPKEPESNLLAGLFGDAPAGATPATATAAAVPAAGPTLAAAGTAATGLPMPRPVPGREVGTTVVAAAPASGGLFGGLFSFGSSAPSAAAAAQPTVATPAAPAPTPAAAATTVARAGAPVATPIAAPVPAVRPTAPVAAGMTTAPATQPAASPAGQPAAAPAAAPAEADTPWWQRLNPFGGAEPPKPTAPTAQAPTPTTVQ